MKSKLYVSNRNKLAISIVLSIFISCGLFRSLAKIVDNKSVFIFGLNVSMILFWIFYINKHIVHNKIKGLMTHAGILLILYDMVSLAKYEFTVNLPTVNRYLWYSFYIFMGLIPVFVLLSILNIGKDENKSINKKWNLLFIGSAIFSVIFITNDLHMLAFKIPNLNVPKEYKQNIFYFLVVLWNIGLLLSAMIVAIKKSLKSKYKKYLYIPIIPCVLSFIYFTYYFIFGNFFKLWLIPEVYGFTIVFFWETLAIIRLIPTNEGYEYFYKNLDSSLFIIDNNNNLIYGSNDELNEIIINEAKENPIFIDENRKYISYKIDGGYCYSLIDLRKINEIKHSLESYKADLKELNELLELENELSFKKELIERKKELYNEIFKSIEVYTKTIKEMLESISPSDVNFINSMRLLSIFSVFVKRYTNLLINSFNSEYINANDLVYSIKETLMYLENYGASAGFIYDNSRNYKAIYILELYEALFKIIEKSLPDLSSISINLTKELVLKISIDEATDIINELDLVKLDDIAYEYEKDEDTIIYKLYIREGD